MMFFVFGWVLIGLGVLGFAAGQVFMAVKKNKIKKELDYIQEEG